MFWIQLIIPLSMALLGLSLLYKDSFNKGFFSLSNLAIKPNELKYRPRSFSNSEQKSTEAKSNYVKPRTLYSEQDRYFLTKKVIVSKAEGYPDKHGVRERLSEIGFCSESSYGEFKYKQLVVVCVAALVPFLALFLMLINLVAAIALSGVFGIFAFFGYDRYLTVLVRKHREEIEAEFPSIIEMMTLAIAAGESPVSAIDRISQRADAKLAKEFRKVIVEVKSGEPFHVALDRMGRKLKSNAIRRFIDALVMAMVRGAPIVEVLHRHVAEARLNQRNLVMDKAGKAETTMMIPIVFLILPISVLFALWPSIHQLSFFAG